MNTWLDGGFWGPYFRRNYIPELESLRDAIFQRVLPAFDGLEAESESVAQAEWDRYMSMPSDVSDDPGIYVEVAQDAGIAHYQRLTNVRQAMLNMSAVTLRHLLDQQMIEFHKRQVLGMSEERERPLHRDDVFRDRLKNAGIDVEGLPSWPTVRELRHVANVVKHGEGDFKSSRSTDFDKLSVLRPELFIPPDIRGTDMAHMFSRRPHVDRPAGGEDLYVDVPDLTLYFDAAIGFWNELADSIEAHSAAGMGRSVP
jgi:hypothetical protein